MAEDQTSIEGNEETQTPESETAEETETPAEETQEETKPEVDYKTKFVESQSEAMRLRSEATRLKEELDATKQKEPVVKEPQSELSAQDQAYQDYLKKLGMYTKGEVEKTIQDKIAPFQAKEDARRKGQQKKILDGFIKSKPNLAKGKDPGGASMQRVINTLKRITPADPFDPNSSLGDDLEWAYREVFGKETNQEALSKAKASGLAEGHEAGDTKVGEGASAKSATQKKTRTSAQEAILKDWGVDDATINKQTEKK